VTRFGGLADIAAGGALGQGDDAIGVLVGRPREPDRHGKAGQPRSVAILHLDSHDGAALGVAIDMTDHTPPPSCLLARGNDLAVVFDADEIGTVDFSPGHGADGERRHHDIGADDDTEKGEQRQEHGAPADGADGRGCGHRGGRSMGVSSFERSHAMSPQRAMK